ISEVLVLESPAPPTMVATWKSHVAFTMQDGTVRLLEIEDGVLRERLRLPFGSGYLGAVAWSQNGRLVAAGTQEGWVRVWEASTGTPVAEFSSGDANIESLVFLADSGDLLAADVRGNYRFWPIDS